MFEKSLSELKSHDLLRTLRTVESINGTKAVIDGRPLTLFCTNDYLGLSSHKAVRDAAKKAIDDHGFGSGSAPLISGRTKYQAKLEEELAHLKGAQSALVFGSGYLANTSVIPSLAREGDLILSDSLNHASIIDGCRLSRADVLVYEHCDTASLEMLLKKSYARGRKWIVTEGVFSMDGDIAPVPEILELSGRYGATIILDDAHGTGTVGQTGRGTLEHFGLPSEGVVQVGTLGKALGSYGAFVAADRDAAAWLVNSARSFMFSTALPPAACAAASAAIGIKGKEPQILERLRRNQNRLRSSLTAAGIKVAGEGTPIVPVIVGRADEALKISNSLMDAGFFTPAIRPPTVPDGESRIRLTVSALHMDNEIDALASALAALVKR